MNIFDYFNYRKYLSDFYKHQKVVSAKFSYRYFAQRAGFKSSGLYLDLVNERKNITPALLPKFLKGLNLKEKEAKYFALMVDFTHASTAKAKQEIFEKMLALLPKSIKKLSRDQKEYFSKWYYVATRESLNILNIDENYADLARFLSPRITVPQAKQAIRLLHRLGLIHQSDGFWKPCSQTVSSGSEINALFVHDFQKQMIDLGKEAIVNYNKDKRNISCTTMSISPMGLQRIINKIDDFRREIIEIVRSDEDESVIAHLNIQFFPLSQGDNDE